MPVPLGFCGVTVGLPDTMTHSDVPLRGIIALMAYFNYFLGGLRGFLYRANDLENGGFNIHNAGVGGSSLPIATNKIKGLGVKNNKTHIVRSHLSPQ